MVCVIFYLALSAPPETPQPFRWFDKLLHFGAFGLLSLLFALPGYKIKLYIRMLGFPFAYGAAIEIMQFFIPEREADILDWSADAIGSLAAFLAVVLLRKLFPGRTN